MRADLQIWTLVGPLSLRPTTNNDDNPSLLHHFFFFFLTLFIDISQESEKHYTPTQGKTKDPKNLKGTAINVYEVSKNNNRLEII